ncbi:BTB domain-containing protein [Mycena kentingensis (nom. inval.)]|nr:BTB domain-containing protein [Mycena kentingensis (nom. inval.)]
MSLPDERPAKRPRSDDAAAGPDTTPIERSPEFWLDDGNIILQVESTQFRVMKSFLAMHSTVFRDMFSVPLPPDEPLVEGCPVVVLTGDTKIEWDSLFRVMFPKVCFDKKPNITQLAAVLRLSGKYDMAEFGRECRRRVRGDFPATLKEASHVWQFVSPDSGECVSQLVVSAREVGLHSVLPSMFYKLVMDLVDWEGNIQKQPQIPAADHILFFTGCVKLLSLHKSHPQIR